MGGRTIEDVPVGRRASFSKTVSESDVYLFAGISGDLDPNHVDEEYARATSLGGRVAHGALILGYDRVRFVRPVRLGDTITVSYQITGVVPERERILSHVEVTNQRGEVVCVADHLMQLVS